MTFVFLLAMNAFHWVCYSILNCSNHKLTSCSFIRAEILKLAFAMLQPEKPGKIAIQSQDCIAAVHDFQSMISMVCMISKPGMQGVPHSLLQDF